MAIHWIPCLVSFRKWFRNHPKKGKNPKTKTTRNNEIKFWKGYPTVLIKMDGGLGFLLRRTRFPRFRALKPAHADARKPTDPLPSPSPICGYPRFRHMSHPVCSHHGIWILRAWHGWYPVGGYCQVSCPGVSKPWKLRARRWYAFGSHALIPLSGAGRIITKG